MFEACKLSVSRCDISFMEVSKHMWHGDKVISCLREDAVRSCVYFRHVRT